MSIRTGWWITCVVCVMCVCGQGFAQSEACCLPDCSCVDLPPVLCPAVDGTPAGPGTTCADNDCVGACCLPDGTCIENMNVHACDEAGGVAYAAITCEQANCPVFGACCLPDGSCMDSLEPGQCEQLDGVWQGANTMCDDLECILEGACCLPDGTCEIVDGPLTCEAMFGATWLGVGSTCRGAQCEPVGACCIAETGECLDGLTMFECEYENPVGTGKWQGAETTCAETACPLFGFGACCIDDNTCFDFHDQGDCLAKGGDWLGDNTVCSQCCPLDIDASGIVEVSDLLVLLADWGSCPPNPGTCLADVNFTGNVDVDDLLAVLDGWGTRCPPLLN